MDEDVEERRLDETANSELSSTETVDPNLHPVDMPRIRVIATELQEPNIWLIRSVAAMLGMEAVETIFQRTQTIEAAGGSVEIVP